MQVEEALTQQPVTIVAAHPDDETVSAGGLLARMHGLRIVHVTGGSPRKLADARAAGFETHAAYQDARRRELLRAMETAVPFTAVRRAGASGGEERPDPDRVSRLLQGLDLMDQEASLEMAPTARRLAGLLEALQPAVVLTHPYEGGHPDHDATAFVVHAACVLMASPPKIYEFTSYHATQPMAAAEGEEATPHADGPPAMETGRFLPGQDRGEVVTLSAADRERKARAIACFTSQAQMLHHFPVDEERYRAAPVYDFTQAPHPGKLFYEYFEWGMSGERWRRLAEEAARALNLPETL